MKVKSTYYCHQKSFSLMEGQDTNKDNDNLIGK